uniref:PLP-dependent transferase n=1 Tax=Priestia megaterium TaxID=1404 RepID=UPI001649C736
LHPKVKGVYYGGDKKRTGYCVMKKEMKKGGGVVCFEVEGGYKERVKVVNQVKVIWMGVSVGDGERVIEDRGWMRDGVVGEEGGKEMGM